MTRLVNVHQHLNSLDTGSNIDDFIRREKELQAKYLVCTDHGFMGALYIAYVKAKKAGLKLIPGIESYLYDANDPVLAKYVPRGTNGYKDYLKYTHLTVHAQDILAYEELCQVLSKAPREVHGSEAKAIFDWKDLERLGGQNITFGTGCLIGAVARHLLLDRTDKYEIAEAYYLRLKSILKPGNFIVELFPHKCTHNWVEGVFLQVSTGDSTETLKYYSGKKVKTNAIAELTVEQLAKEFSKKTNKHTHLLGVKNRHVWELCEKQLVSVEHVEDFIRNECSADAPDGDVQLTANKYLYHLAQKHGDPVVVSLDSHLAYPEDKVVQDVCLAQSGSWRMHEVYHVKSNEECLSHFRETMGIKDAEFEKWVDNSVDWASKFDHFAFNYKPQLPTDFYPKDVESYFKELVEKHGRMKDDPEWHARLAKELDAYRDNGVMDMLPYFFPFEEVVEEYSNNGKLPGVGRGSGAGTLVAYLLGVTHLDPMKYRLSFERFFTKIRAQSGKFPDIDQDLPSIEFLTGAVKDFITVEFEDGTTKEYAEDELIETDQGLLTIDEIVARDADIQGAL